MFRVGELVRVVTNDDLRYGGRVLSIEAGFVRIHDDHSGRDIILNLSNVRRCEVQE